MKKRRRQKWIIGTLCAVVIGMTVGYAALGQLLNINGTSQITGDFKVQFTKIEEGTMKNATTISTGGIGTTTANFTVDLEKPGSSAIYNLTVSNLGSIDAVLTGIDGLDESNLSEPLDIKFFLAGIDEQEKLNAGASKTFQVRVVWDTNASTIPSKSKNLVLKLNYEQVAGSDGGSNNASTTLIDNNLQTDLTSPVNGLYGIDQHGALTTKENAREYRYVGNNVDNYVAFGTYASDQYEYVLEYTFGSFDPNPTTETYRLLQECQANMNGYNQGGYVITRACEKSPTDIKAGDPMIWQIVGIFNRKLKLVTTQNIGKLPWNKPEGTGNEEGVGNNDWTTSTLQTYLNSEFLNSIDPDTQRKIDTSTWYLGSFSDYDTEAVAATAQTFYEKEHGTIVYPGRQATWSGKVALMNVSDYGFSTGGWSETTREQCMSLPISQYNAHQCDYGNWLYDAQKGETASATDWFLNPGAWNGSDVFMFSPTSGHWRYYTSSLAEVRPSFYITESIQILSGTGKENDPYILG